MVIQEAPIALATEAQRPPLVCCHHWLIEPNDRPVSRGVCRYCHEVRECKNFMGDDPREHSWHEAEANRRIPVAAGAGFPEEADEF